MDRDRIVNLLDGYAGLPEVRYLEHAGLQDLEKTLRLHETLTAELRELEGKTALDRYLISLIEDKVESALRANIYAAQHIPVARRCADLAAALRQIEDWLDDMLVIPAVMPLPELDL